MPPSVSVPNRNYMNLLEAPILFYVVSLLLFVTDSVTTVAISLAWLYVVLRVIHSAIHLTYNNVIHRLTFFGLSSAVLLGMWIVAGVEIFSRA